MNPLTFILNLFKPPTIAEIIEHDIKVEQQVIESCNQTITNALFQKALSSAKLAALQRWTISQQSTERKDSQ